MSSYSVVRLKVQDTTLQYRSYHYLKSKLLMCSRVVSSKLSNLLFNFLYLPMWWLHVNIYLQSNLHVDWCSSGIMVLICDLIGERGILHNSFISHMFFLFI